MTPHTTTACTGGLHEWLLVRDYVGTESFPIIRAEEYTAGGFIKAVPCRRTQGKHVFKALAAMFLYVRPERVDDDYVEIVGQYLKCANCDKETNLDIKAVDFQEAS